MRGNRGIRDVEERVDNRITRERDRCRPVDEIVGILGADDVNECEPLRRRFFSDRGS
jgi:hypothetical protein